MSLVDVARDAAARARGLKERTVARADGPPYPLEGRGTDIAPTIQGWRGEEPVVALIPGRVNRDDMLQAAHIAAVGFGCDVLATSSDSFRAAVEHSERNPVTGQMWRSGDMQTAAEEHRGLEQGWIVEALATLVVNRAGDTAGAIDPYRIESHQSAGPKRRQVNWHKIEWLGEPMISAEPGTWEGTVPETLARSMNTMTADVWLERIGIRAADFGVPDHTEARTHMDIAIVRTLLDGSSLEDGPFRGAIMLQANDPQRAQIIHDSGVRLGWTK